MEVTHLRPKGLNNWEEEKPLCTTKLFRLCKAGNEKLLK